MADSVNIDMGKFVTTVLYSYFPFKPYTFSKLHLLKKKKIFEKHYALAQSETGLKVSTWHSLLFRFLEDDINGNF